MAKLSVLVVATLLVSLARAEDYDIEILPESCDCRDWYGLCRTNGEKWVDDDVWKYSCEGKDRSPVIFSGCHGPGGDVPVGQNVTIDGLWNVCTQDDQKLYFEIGCYYFNETHTDLLLRVGEHAYNGLIEHVCAKRQEYPAIVQYYTQVRKDVDVKHPTNKGVNRNFPPPLQKLIDEDQNIRWLHNSAVHFVKNDVAPRSFTRFLPSSRKPLG
uniref:Uncharacterized protein n=1 Tax=Caenorhabditis japonica TaxID=281687 RepID=A0A8R1DEE3_CAEJA